MRRFWKKFEEHMTPIIVVFAFALGIGFTIFVSACNIKGIEIQAEMIDKFYDVIIGELLSLAFIKGTKHISEHFGNSKIGQTEQEGEEDDN